MAQLTVRNLAGEDLGTVEVSDDIFVAPVNEALLHQAVQAIRANRRLGTHKTKTRGDVSGGGAKPWRQKGTGRARQGSRVSPLWRGGGIVFGPRPRDYKQDLPKKMKRVAMRSSLSARFGEGAVSALDSFTIEAPRTKELARSLGKLGLVGRILIVADGGDENARLSARNLPTVELANSASLNVVDVLGADHLVFTRDALAGLEQRLGSKKGDA